MNKFQKFFRWLMTPSHPDGFGGAAQEQVDRMLADAFRNPLIYTAKGPINLGPKSYNNQEHLEKALHNCKLAIDNLDRVLKHLKK